MSCCTSFFSKAIVRLRAVDAAHCAHVTCATLPVLLPPHLSPATASMAGGPPRYRMHPPDLEVLPSFDEVSPSFEKGWPLSKASPPNCRYAMAHGIWVPTGMFGITTLDAHVPMDGIATPFQSTSHVVVCRPNHPALLQKSVLLHDALQPVHAAIT